MHSAILLLARRVYVHYEVWLHCLQASLRLDVCEHTKMTHIKAPSGFGEVALLGREIRKASIIAFTPLIVMVINSSVRHRRR